MKAFSNEVVDRKMLSEVIKEVLYHKYTIGSKFNNSNSNDKHKIVFEVTDYEKTLCDKDDHYEIFDGHFFEPG
jgi:hypothetical protein